MKVLMMGVTLACGTLAASAAYADYVPAEAAASFSGAKSVRLQIGTLTVNASDGSGLTALRTFYYYVPTNYDPKAGTIVFLHGGTGSGLDAARDEADYQWTAVAENHNALVIFPNGFKIVNPKYDPMAPSGSYNSYYYLVTPEKVLPNDQADQKPVYVSYMDTSKGQMAQVPRYERSWNNCSDSDSLANAPDNYPGGSAQFALDLDDVQFMRALQSWTQTKFSGQAPAPDRFYVAGHSEGSKMAERLALEANDIVTAIAVAAGNVPKANDRHYASGGHKCAGYDAPWAGTSKDRKVPVLLLKGDMDPRIPFSSVSPPPYVQGGRADVPPDTADICQVNGQGDASAGCTTGLQYNYTETLGFWQWKLGIAGVTTSTSGSPASMTYLPATPNNPGDSSTPNSFSRYNDDAPCFDNSGSNPPTYGSAAYYQACIAAASDAQRDLADYDGSFVFRYTYGLPVNGASGPSPAYALTFMHVYGGGHCFPGAYPQTAATCASGFKNRDTLQPAGSSSPSFMAENIWTFFNNFKNADTVTKTAGS